MGGRSVTLFTMGEQDNGQKNINITVTVVNCSYIKWFDILRHWSIHTSSLQARLTSFLKTYTLTKYVSFVYLVIATGFIVKRNCNIKKESCKIVVLVLLCEMFEANLNLCIYWLYKCNCMRYCCALIVKRMWAAFSAGGFLLCFNCKCKIHNGYMNNWSLCCYNWTRINEAL